MKRFKIVRELKFDYMLNAVDMLYEQWDIGKKQSKCKGKACAWYYLFCILEESYRLVGIVDKYNDKLVGFVGYSNLYKTKITSLIWKVLGIITTYRPSIKNRQGLINYMNEYDYIDRKTMINSGCGGYLSIIILNKRYRKHGLGRKMFKVLKKLAQRDGVKILSISTDDSCNYEFYDNIGCRRVFSKKLKEGASESCKAYAYICDLDSINV